MEPTFTRLICLPSGLPTTTQARRIAGQAPRACCRTLCTATAQELERKKPALTLRESMEVVRRREQKKKTAREMLLNQAAESIPTFSDTLRKHNLYPLTRAPTTILQVNIGKLCNLTCHHCHVESGPTRREENMNVETVDRVIALMNNSPNIKVLDITGGAPELNPSFRRLALAGRARGLEVIDRCNLAVLYEPGQEDTPEFLADNKISVVASMPCYSIANVDKQRGKGTFNSSICGLQLLNSYGYGRDPTLPLTLVYNPGGPFLPGPQKKLEADYRVELKKHFGIDFTNLITITNLPIKRYADDLYRMGKYTDYMHVLLHAFNPSTVSGLMCRNTVSVSWTGHLHDCDFNQALDMPTMGPDQLGNSRPLSIWDIQDASELDGLRIATAKHCYGCTAGTGSSCGGALA